MAIVRLTREFGSQPALVSLVGVCHNLLRQWADP
jgi:predicted 2-oxoglutarate/Fe(II)-dependent dioxygenase YbiX